MVKEVPLFICERHDCDKTFRGGDASQSDLASIAATRHEALDSVHVFGTRTFGPEGVPTYRIVLCKIGGETILADGILDHSDCEKKLADYTKQFRQKEKEIYPDLPEISGTDFSVKYKIT